MKRYLGVDLHRTQLPVSRRAGLIVDGSRAKAALIAFELEELATAGT